MSRARPYLLIELAQKIARTQNYQIRDSIQKTQGIDSDHRSDWIEARKTLKGTDSIQGIQSQHFIANAQYYHKVSTKHNKQDASSYSCSLFVRY